MTDDTERKITSDSLIEDLLKNVQSMDEPITIERIAASHRSSHKSKKKKSKHKKHKHKSKKRKRDRSRSRSRSGERKRSRSSSNSSDDGDKKDDELVDDDLPLGAEHYSIDHVSVKEEVPISASSSEDMDKLSKKENLQEVPKNEVIPLSKVEDKEKDVASAFERKSVPMVPRSLKIQMKVELKKATLEKLEEASDKKNDLEKKNDETKKEEVEEKEKEANWLPVKPKKEKRNSRRHRSTSSERENDEKSRKRRSRSRSPKRRKRTRSRSRERSRRKDRKRSLSKDSIRRTRSTSRDRRRRSKSPLRRRSRSPRRRRRSRSRSAEINKERLLAIAKRNAKHLDENDQPTRSVDDFISYCQRLQKKQEKERRKDAGEAVSSGDDMDVEEPEITFKHPFALPKQEPIKINIMTVSPSLAGSDAKAICAPMDEGALRLVFPVSSGAVHKENVEWKPILKTDDVPKTCTEAMKKQKAISSLEMQRRRLEAMRNIAPPPVPTEIGPQVGIVYDPIPPPPPPPPMPSLDAYLRPPTPPQQPACLYIPPPSHMVIKEPGPGPAPNSNDIAEAVRQRSQAKKRLERNPNDFAAHRELREANEKLDAWATLKSLPGKFTGSTGVRVLQHDQLQPHDPRYHAWVRKDMFKKTTPVLSGFGMNLMQKMGWRPGEGLGKQANGNLEPLVLDVKNDRKGLVAEQDTIRKSQLITNAQGEMEAKNPISIVMEYAAKHKWNPPEFVCHEYGLANNKTFQWSVSMNGVQYQCPVGCKTKKEGKTVLAQYVLQQMGIGMF